MPSSRSKHAGCVHAASGHVYILAGRNGNVALRDFWRFHPGNGRSVGFFYSKDLSLSKQSLPLNLLKWQSIFFVSEHLGLSY